MKELADLFLTFCRIGGLTFGGGYAMLPMIQKEVVEKRGWASEEEVMDYYALSQCTPGVIAVNNAIFIGNQVKGVAGGVAAALGVAFPSVAIITIIAMFIENFIDIAAVQYAFAGIRVAVTMLVVNAVIKLWKTGVKDMVGVVLVAIGFVVSVFTSLSPILLVIGGVAAGVVIMKIKRKGGEA